MFTESFQDLDEYTITSYINFPENVSEFRDKTIMEKISTTPVRVKTGNSTRRPNQIVRELSKKDKADYKYKLENKLKPNDSDLFMSLLYTCAHYKTTVSDLILFDLLP